MRRISWGAVAFAFGLALAAPDAASAAVVQFTDTAGQPLVSEEITLEAASTTDRQLIYVRTDRSGNAEVPETLGPGSYWVGAPGFVGRWVTFPTQRVVLPPAPWRVQNPKGRGNPALALGFNGSWVKDLQFTLDHQEQTATDPAGNVVQSATRNNDPAASTSRFGVDFDRWGAIAGVPFQIGSFDVGAGSLFVAPELIGGWQSWNLAIHDRQMGTKTEFEGSGGVLGGALEVLYSPKSANWFVSANFSYYTNLGDDADRSGGAPSPPGEPVRNSAELCYDEWQAGARGGYQWEFDSPVFPTVAPWGGVLYRDLSVGLHGQRVRTAPGGTTETIKFKNEWESNGPLGWVGVDFRFLRAHPIYGRVAATFNDKDLGVHAKMSWEFDFWDD